jgi:tetratricopeptide (TPR) repeat protein
MSHPWINRKFANQIFQNILNQNEAVQVFYIKAPAGAGKTFLARDIGTRLGSQTGYEAGHLDNIHWSGIIDLYDPATNNNRKIEETLIKALSTHPEVDFRDYNNERKNYLEISTGGAVGGTLEEQRREVERAFSTNMRQLSREKYLVWAFDTVERLQSTLDPTELKLGEQNIEDTASVTGWLMYQITRLSRATVLLFGRPADRLQERLAREIDEVNYDRDRKISFKVLDLTILEDDEVDEFFQFRSRNNIVLQKALDDDLKTLLKERTEKNPLYLDIALQTIIETGSANSVRDILNENRETDGINDVGEILIQTYMNQGTPERKSLLGHLTLARNGLFDNLLACMEIDHVERLQDELGKMANLPFVKTRQVLANTNDNKAKLTYFLHDAMYVICDKVILHPVETKTYCERIVEWYDKKIADQTKADEITGHHASGGRRSDAILDLLVESFFYRLRANPKKGYEWYLHEADYALRAVETGLEMRLRDSMAQFAVNANPELTTDSSSSELDQNNIHAMIPDLWKQFSIDSATLWVKRLSFRGRHADALKIAEAATWVKEIYETNQKRYSLTYADFNMWKGQALMYLGDTQAAFALYQQNLKTLKSHSASELRQNQGEHGDFTVWRIGLIKGRTYNNLGYSKWMYQGKYKSALLDLTQAVEYFKITGLIEEEANARDNMGRVHALLWHQPSAKLQIEEGLAMRESTKMTYRSALSRISQANMHIRFGQAKLALDIADKTLETFKTLDVPRGIGLALLTRSMVHRTMAEAWREQELTVEAAIDHIKAAIDDLTTSLRIFKDAVQEKIRYVYALNEMGSCYRTLYFLRLSNNSPDEQKQFAYDQSLLFYKDAIMEAAKADYFVEKLDSMQDIAVLQMRAKKYDEAMQMLEDVKKNIPNTHQFETKSGLAILKDDETTDAYYKLMGQVELLIGAVIFDSATETTTASDLPKETILDSMEHYMLAVAYYYRFSSVSPNAYIMTTNRIYKRLSQCDTGLVHQIKKIYLAQWIKKYHIPTVWVTPLFDEIFEMLGI